MKKDKKIFSLLSLVSMLCAIVLLSSCDKVDNELDDLVLTLNAQIPDTAYFGSSIEIKLITNKAKEVQLSLAPESNLAETVHTEVLKNENNNFVYTTQVEIPEDGSWNGNYVLKVVSVSSDGSTVEKTAPVYLRNSPIQDFYLVGGSSIAGWEPSNGLKLMRYTKDEDGLVTEWYDIFGYFTVDGSGLKVLPTTTGWDGGYGASKTQAGILDKTGDAGNIEIPKDGFYRLRVNPKKGDYELVESNWGIIGDATPGGWDNDTDMMLVSASKGKYEWTATINLEAGKEFKFRENDGWAVNLGLDGAGPKLKYDGSNIVAGVTKQYVIKLKLDPQGYTYTIQ